MTTPPRSSLLQDLLRLWGVARPYRGAVFVAGLAATAGLGVSLVMPLALRALLNASEQPGGARALNVSAMVLLVLYSFRAGLNIFGGMQLRYAGESLARDLRVQLFGVIIRQSLSFFATTGVGSMTTRLTSDLASVRSVATDASISAALQVLKLVGAATIMLVVNWRLALVVLTASPFAAVAARYFGARMRALSASAQERLAESNARATEALSAPRLVKAFDREAYEIARYATAVASMRTQALSNGRWLVTFQALIEVLFGVSTIVLFWYGGRQVLAGALRIGDLVAFLFYAQTVSGAIGEVASSYAGLKGAQGAMDRVFEWIALPPGLQEPSTYIPLPQGAPALEFCNASLEYASGRKAVSDVSLRVAPGEHVAIVGRSGGGKSSLISLVPRLYDVSDGSVRLAGVDVRDVSVAALRAVVAYVPQDVQLMRGSIRQNIAYGADGVGDDLVLSAALAALVTEFASALPAGLDTPVGENGVQLSGGQRQRIAIARALVRRARVLLLDEATSALDAETEGRILRTIRTCQPGVTIIAVTHRLAIAKQFPRIVVVESGRVVQDGSHDVLILAENAYRSLVEQSEGHLEGVLA
jgi:ATP-binding cassette, subfamily B, bacterial MsbA